MDPFTILPPEVCDSILQYLSGNEILKASTVSKTWNSIIGASSKIMQKIKLNLFCKRGTNGIDGDTERMLIESHRKYQHVAMKFQSLNIYDFRKILQSNHGQWKFVEIHHLIFNTTSEFIELVSIFEDTVEELIIKNIYIRDADMLKAFKFPNLKVLKLIDADVRNGSINGLFTDCENLKKFWVVSYGTSDAIANVKLILKNNKNLQHFESTSQILSEIVQSDASFNFNLQVFKVTMDRLFKSIVNYNLFLQNQLQHMIKISFDEITCPDSLKLMFQMPNLRSLNMGRINTLDFTFDNIQLKVNKTIEKLSYWDSRNKIDIMKRFIEAAPNVKKVEMFSLTQAMMEHLSLTAKHLEVLKLRTFEATDVSSKELFPKLKKVKVDIITSDDHITSIPVDEANPLVKLLKDSNYIILH